MAITDAYANFDLGSGSNDGTSEANAWQSWSQMETDHVAGERVWIKKTSSPWQPGANIAFAVSATDLLISDLVGYDVTIGDGVRFVIDLEANILTISGEGCYIADIDTTGTSISNSVVINGDVALIDSSSLVNTGTTTNTHRPLSVSDNAIVNNCYLETSGTGSGSECLTIARGSVTNCEMATTNGGISTAISFRQGSITGNVIYNKGSVSGYGIKVTGFGSGGQVTIQRNTINGFTDNIDITSVDDIATALTPVLIMRNLITNGTTGVANTDSATKVMTVRLLNNAFYNNTTDTEFGDNEDADKISLSADPYTDAGSDDYSLNNTAGGGADCRDAALFGGE